MVRTLLRLTGLAGTVVLTACQTVPMGDPARSAELKKFTANPAAGQIYVCRDSRFFGAAVTATIELDGKAIGRLGRSNYVFAELPPGEHTVIAKTLEHDSTFPFRIDAGQQVYFSTWISFGVIAGRGIIDTASTEEGRKCVTESELVGPLDVSGK